MRDKVNEIIYNDPYINEIEVGRHLYRSTPITKENLKKVACVLIVTNHSKYDYDFIVKNAKLVIDTRNATKCVKEGKEKVVRLGT